MVASAAYVCQEAQPLGVSQVKDLLQLLGNTDLQAIVALSDGSRTGKVNSSAAELGCLEDLLSQAECHNAEWHGSFGQSSHGQLAGLGPSTGGCRRLVKAAKLTQK